MTLHERRGMCGLCSAGCWIVATLDEEGRLVGVRPDEGTPMGRLCKIGEHSPEVVYAEHRLRRPLRRTGPKGTFEFEPISWDEAMQTIVGELQRIKTAHGAEATAIYTGVGSFETAHCDIFQPKGVATSSACSVLFPFGSPNTMGVGALCYVSFGMIAPHVTMGRMFMNMFSDIESAELVVVWGTNPATDLPPVDMDRILEARSRGAEVVVIDPRRTVTAKLAEADWVPIRPGTDGALALGMCRVLIEEELYDESFVRDWTVGFEPFARYVQHFRPEVVERITGVPAGTVRSLARRIADARGVSQLMYTGMEYSNSGVQGIRAALTLWALAGQLDVPGGLCFSMRGNSFPINRAGHVPNPDVGPRLGRNRFPVYIDYRDEAHAIALPESVLEGRPYRIRSLIVLGGSILTAWPNPELWKRTLAGLEFLVTIDRQLTADAAYADLVLPAATYYEIESYVTYGAVFRIRERLIEPVGEARGDLDILTELAHRLGYGHLYPADSEARLRHVLEESGFTLEQVRAAGGTVAQEAEIMQYRKWEKGLLREDGQTGFETPSRKFEIASSVLEEYGYDPLPVYTEPTEGPLAQPELARDYPLVFNSGARARTSFHTQHHGIRGLAKRRPEPGVEMHTSDAQARGIRNGDRVLIKTPRGQVAMRARVTGDIVPGAIDANHACGSPVGPKAWQDANVNALTDLENHDPISGFPVYKALLCEVVKAGQDATAEERVIVDGEQHYELNPAPPADPAAMSDPAAASDPATPSGATRPASARSRPGPSHPRRLIYLDNNATTPLSEEVRREIEAVHEQFGNPSSIHRRGRDARRIVEHARRQVAQALGCTARRIIFTGSGSEANNLAIKGLLWSALCATAMGGSGSRRPGGSGAVGRAGTDLVTSAVEHPSVLQPCRWLERQGAHVHYLPVDGDGRVDPADLAGALADGPAAGGRLVTIMLANNEVGTLQPIPELASICRRHGVPLHVDAVQGLGKVPFTVEELGCDLLTISAHKIHGPKGVGALFRRKGIEIDPLIHGGAQEHGLRASTENVAGIAGLGACCERVPAYLREMKRVAGLRDRLEHGLRDIVPGFKLNGPATDRLPNTLSLSLKGLRGESVVLEMDKRGIHFSAGSACKSGSPDPSHALLAMGLSEEEAHCTIRLSLGTQTRAEDIAETLSQFEQMLEQSKQTVRFVACK